MQTVKPLLSDMKLKPTTMKLSDKTISVLKNFSSINQSILFKEGNKLRTISVMKNILAEATVTEEFMQDFGIYDLNQFLNGLSLHSSPELDFANNGYVMIREGKSRSKYFFADPNVIVTPPEKEIKLPSEDEIIKELKDYITRTYDQHYSAGDDKIQTLDLIEACGDGEAFCRSNILKYASRYDKKGTARRDIMKILHYAVLLMHFNDKNAQRETYPQ